MDRKFQTVRTLIMAALVVAHVSAQEGPYLRVSSYKGKCSFSSTTSSLFVPLGFMGTAVCTDKRIKNAGCMSRGNKTLDMHMDVGCHAGPKFPKNVPFLRNQVMSTQGKCDGGLKLPMFKIDKGSLNYIRADGTCLSAEQGFFAKATCSPSGNYTLQQCEDSTCSKCTKVKDIATYMSQHFPDCQMKVKTTCDVGTGQYEKPPAKVKQRESDAMRASGTAATTFFISALTMIVSFY